MEMENRVKPMEDNPHFIILMLATASISLGFVKLMRIRHLAVNGVRTVGRIVATRYEPMHRYDNETGAYLTIQFQTPVGMRQCQHFLPAPIIGGLSHGEVAAAKGKTITVIYDQNNPKRVTTNIIRETIVTWVLLLLGLALLFAFITYGDQVIPKLREAW